jgi:hypothetical protein
MIHLDLPWRRLETDTVQKHDIAVALVEEPAGLLVR